MSADNVTICPRCKEHQLLEYKSLRLWVGQDPSQTNAHLELSYQARCKSCNWKVWLQNDRLMPQQGEVMYTLGAVHETTRQPPEKPKEGWRPAGEFCDAHPSEPRLTCGKCGR